MDAPIPLVASPPPLPHKQSRFTRPVIMALGTLAFGLATGGIVFLIQLKEPAKSTAEAGEKKADDDHRSIVFSEEKQKAADVEIGECRLAPLESIVWRTGRLALNEDRIAHLCPPTEGIIQAVPVRLGQTVQPGQVLAVLDSREFGFLKLELLKARTALDTERENTDRIKTTTANAAELLKLLTANTPLATIEKQMAEKPIGDWRSQLLGAYSRRNRLQGQLASQKNTAGAISESMILKTESELEAAEASYTALLEELRYQVRYQARQAEQKLRETQTAYDVLRAKLLAFGITSQAIEQLDPLNEGVKAYQLELKAPFAGTIVEKHAVMSERVGPSFQMFVLADLTELWLQADLFEADLPMLAALGSRPIRFRSAVAGIPEGQAEVLSTGELIDKSSRSLTLTALVKNPDRRFKPGTFVEVGFQTGNAKPVLQVPISAVFRFENKPFVFVTTDQKTFVRREVELGPESGEMVTIKEGLKPGERIVTKGGFVMKSELLKDLMAGE